VAKVIQKLANLTNFGAEEEYMQPMNSLIEEQKQNLRIFIDHIGVFIAKIVTNVILKKPAENSPPRVRPPIHLEKELASLHRHLKRSKVRMQKLQTEQDVRKVIKQCLQFSSTQH
jgi:hypothetical protein